MADPQTLDSLPDGGAFNPATDRYVSTRTTAGTDVLTSPQATQAIPPRTLSVEAILGVQRGQLTAQTPVIQSISPSSGYLGGGQPILIQGTGLLTVTGITFGSQAVYGFGATDSQIILTTPPSTSAGAVTVTLTSVAGPFGTPATTTTTYTYLASTIATTQTNLFQATNPGGFYYAGPMCLNFDGNVWFPSEVMSVQPPGLSGANGTAFRFNISGIGVIANQNPWWFTGLAHAQHGEIVGSDGARWTFDHHGTISQVRFLNAGDNFGVATYMVPNSGDSDPGGSPTSMIVGPDGWLWQFGGDGGSNGIIWRFDPRNPLQQTKRTYPGLSFAFACIGANGNVFICEENTPGIQEVDINQNLVGSVVSLPAFPNQICLGNDLNLKVTTFAATPQLVSLDRTNLTNQTFTNLPCAIAPGICAGPDGNTWVSGSGVNGASSVDSKVFKINQSGTILSTLTLTGSVGGSPTTHPGGSYKILGGASGEIWVNVQQDPLASPSVQGYVTRIT